MNFAPAILILVLIVLAVLHAWWGFGGLWPGHDERHLVGLVVGRTRSMKMPGLVASLLVATALLAAAVLVALRAKLISIDFGTPVDGLVRMAFWIACAVFALRGVVGFIPPIFAYARGTPFETLNRRFYSPLCLLIAMGFILTAAETG
jgi:hypothetical protein